MLDSFAPRDLAKLSACAVVGGTVSYAADTAIEATTDIDTDNILVDAGTTVLGAIVALRVMPYTDRLVDATANRWQRRRARKTEAKNATTEK